MADNVYGRVWDASSAGYIADLIINTVIPTGTYVKEASLGSDFFWAAGLLEVSVGQTTAQDTSIADLYNYVEDLSTNKADNTDLYPFATNSSVNDALGQRDVSIDWLNQNKIDTSYLLGYTTKIYVDGSLAERDVSIAFLNNNKVDAVYSSNNGADFIQTVQSTGISGGYAEVRPLRESANIKITLQDSNTTIKIDASGLATLNYVDGSISTLNSSIGTALGAYATNSSVNAAGFATNSSVNNALLPYATNASVGIALEPYATNASIGIFKTDYIDPSLNAKIPYTLATATHFTTGHVNRTDSSLVFNNSDRVFTIKVNPAFDIYSNGVKFTKTEDASIQITDTVGLHYVYFDGNGVLQTNTGGWSIISENSPTALIYWNGATGALNDERHSAGRNLEWHLWAHDTIGARYESGLEGTFTNASTYIASGNIHDEDIDVTILAHNGRNRIWYRNVGATVMVFDDNLQAPSARITTGALQYDNGGTITPVTSGGYITNHVYATADVSNNIMVVVAQQEYTAGNAAAKLAAARNAPLPTFPNAATPELKLIYRTIWTNAGGTPTYVESQDYRTSTSLPAGGTPAINAASVTFAPAGNISSSTVQGAIEELDVEKTSIAYVDGSISTLNASIGTALGAYATNASIGTFKTDYIDSSLALRIPNASIGLSSAHSVYWSGGYLEASMGSGTGSTTLAALTDVSWGVTLANDQVLTYDSSWGKWMNQAPVDLSTLTVEASIYFAQTVDVSENFLRIKDASTTYLRINDASTTYVRSIASLFTKNASYLVDVSCNNNTILADTSAMYVIFPNTLPTGFQTTVVNETTGIITLNASTLLTTDSSVVLRDRYAGATVICKSSGVFLAFGNLK